MTSVSRLGYFADRSGKTPNRVPSYILVTLIALLCFTAAAVIFGQTTGLGRVTSQLGAPVAIRDITITRSDADRVVVKDATTGKEIAVYEADKGGFIRGSLRAFERMRYVAGVSNDTPYRIIKWEAGRVSLSDTATGDRLYLDAFGKDNAGAFAALLDEREGAS